MTVIYDFWFGTLVSMDCYQNDAYRKVAYVTRPYHLGIEKKGSVY